MSMNKALVGFAALVALLLGGCSSGLLESKKVDYKSAGKLPPLDIPPDLTAPSRDERYAVPDVNTKSTATYSAYNGERVGASAPSTGQDVLPSAENMRIERSGTQRWLVVSGSPEKLWPQIKEFWQELGFLVNIEMPEAGIMETDWAENRAKIPQDFIRNTIGKVFDDVYSTPERDKFRTRLEKSADGKSTEIYISHRGMQELYTTEGRTETRWQPRPADPELEAEMIRRLMVRLGAEESRAKSLVATPAQQDKATLTRGGEGGGNLHLQEPFDRAWRRVGLALDRVGFTVEDRDRAQGLYFVRYVDPEADAKKDDKGILSKLMFWKSDKPAEDKAQYRIYIKDEGNSASSVQILSREGGVEKSDTAKKILSLLYEQLK